MAKVRIPKMLGMVPSFTTPRSKRFYGGMDNWEDPVEREQRIRLYRKRARQHRIITGKGAGEKAKKDRVQYDSTGKPIPPSPELVQLRAEIQRFKDARRRSGKFAQYKAYLREKSALKAQALVVPGDSPRSVHTSDATARATSPADLLPKGSP